MTRNEAAKQIRAARQRIKQIDREMDDTTDEAQRLGGVKPRSANGWQKLWDRHPELRARFHDLSRQRGEQQHLRDQALMKAPRRRRSYPVYVSPLNALIEAAQEALVVTLDTAEVTGLHRPALCEQLKKALALAGVPVSAEPKGSRAAKANHAESDALAARNQVAA